MTCSCDSWHWAGRPQTRVAFLDSDDSILRCECPDLGADFWDIPSAKRKQQFKTCLRTESCVNVQHYRISRTNYFFFYGSRITNR